MSALSNASEEIVFSLTNDPTVQVEAVSPDMATRWLETNSSNRTIRQNRVDQYARDMKAGRWKLTGEPVKFTADGQLLDGQHRLWAVIEAGVEVELFVARGLDREVQRFMDTGTARTAADNLGMRGEANTHVLAAAARIGVIVDSERLFRDRKAWAISHAEVYDWVAAHPTVRESACKVTSGKAGKVALPPSVKAYCHYRFAELDPYGADEFFCALGALINIPEGSPIHALSSRLRTLRERRIKADPATLIGVTFRAWNAWREGRGMAVIPLKPSAGVRALPVLH